MLCTAILSLFILITSCSNEEVDEIISDESLVDSKDDLELDDDPELKAAWKVFEISDFYIETSWLSGENSRSTSSFSSTSIDNESWYDKDSNGYYTMKSLKTDGNRSEWKEKNQSSLYSGKKMTYLAKVESIPENGVTIAQVHNRGNGVNRPWLRVYIDDDRKIKIKVTTNNPSNSSGTYKTFTGGTYSQGSNYILSITYLGNKATVKVKKTNGTVLIEETITPTSSWNNYSNTYYFKAGVYTEGDDKQPKITFRYFYFDD
ncbi:hypothetical protein GCM10022393_14430 [Aquimarina addita]|uniref:Alginate lyase 2 domain-containing protein n=2 Tax=Aquimarina addita TaxID=870485 RepID=A0ABP7XFK9_9FLAO